MTGVRIRQADWPAHVCGVIYRPVGMIATSQVSSTHKARWQLEPAIPPRLALSGAASVGGGSRSGWEAVRKFDVLDGCGRLCFVEEGRVRTWRWQQPILEAVKPMSGSLVHRGGPGSMPLPVPWYTWCKRGRGSAVEQQPAKNVGSLLSPGTLPSESCIVPETGAHGRADDT